MKTDIAMNFSKIFSAINLPVKPEETDLDFIRISDLTEGYDNTPQMYVIDGNKELLLCKDEFVAFFRGSLGDVCDGRVLWTALKKSSIPAAIYQLFGETNINIRCRIPSVAYCNRFDTFKADITEPVQIVIVGWGITEKICKCGNFFARRGKTLSDINHKRCQPYATATYDIKANRFHDFKYTVNCKYLEYIPSAEIDEKINTKKYDGIYHCCLNFGQLDEVIDKLGFPKCDELGYFIPKKYWSRLEMSENKKTKVEILVER